MTEFICPHCGSILRVEVEVASGVAYEPIKYKRDTSHHQEWPDIQLRDDILGARVTHSLKWNDIRTVRELVAYTDQEMDTWGYVHYGRNIGSKLTGVIVDYLRSIGYKKRIVGPYKDIWEAVNELSQGEMT
jgi:hypothetical protein